VSALGASEELRSTLIGPPRLHHPVKSPIVFALRAFDPNLRLSAQTLFLISYHYYLFFDRPIILVNGAGFDLGNLTAFSTDQALLISVNGQQRTALGTELQSNLLLTYAQN
jgi:hypothetical protein